MVILKREDGASRFYHIPVPGTLFTYQIQLYDQTRGYPGTRVPSVNSENRVLSIVLSIVNTNSSRDLPVARYSSFGTSSEFLSPNWRKATLPPKHKRKTVHIPHQS
eukprot:3935657-Rhodomonas_salina.1